MNISAQFLGKGLPLAGLLILLAACEHKATDKVADKISSEGAGAVKQVAANTSLCPGHPPSGNLVAQRVESANSDHTEPGLYEGAVWIKDGFYFSDFTFGPGFPSRIRELSSDGTVKTVIEDSGSNGLAVDSQGNIIAATHKYKGLSRYDLNLGTRQTLVDQYQGRVFNSPNDLAIAKDGTIYFTDPAFQRDAAPGGQDKTSVYRVATDGRVTLVDDSIANPNGVSLSPDESVLYVNGGGEQGILRAYPLVDGAPQKGKDLVVGLSIPDGMAVDCQGNIYVTEHVAQQVRVFNPLGQQLALIKTDANVTNAAFGGADGKTLYLTGAGAIWTVPLEITGSPY